MIVPMVQTLIYQEIYFELLQLQFLINGLWNSIQLAILDVQINKGLNLLGSDYSGTASYSYTVKTLWLL